MVTMNHHKVLPLLCCFLLLCLTSAFSLTSSPTTPPAQPPSPGPSWDDEADYFYTPPSPPPSPPAPCHPDDRNTLLRIKQALNNTAALSSWIPDTDCCNTEVYWDFVHCNQPTGRVTVLSFNGDKWENRNDIPRVLPSEVGDLTYLESLTFYNLVTGPIPRALVKLQHLQELDLSNNLFNGPVPSFLRKMQNLIFLFLGGNRLTGHVPSFFNQMQNLTWLALNGNNLTGSIPGSLGDAPKLYYLKLNNNNLTGRIPERLGHFKNVDPFGIQLYLNNNQLSGPIPRSFGGVKFSYLFLNDNNLTGDASFLFGKEKRLNIINLSHNKLSFNMSRVEIPPQLMKIGLNHNRIYGSLPHELTNNWLTYFNVSYNRLCGQIPVGGYLQKFDETAYFHNKCLCGAPLAPCP